MEGKTDHERGIANVESDSSLEANAPNALSLTIESLTFSDETRLGFNPDDIVVFVGPNNSGKSASLREIEYYFSSKSPSTSVIKKLNFRKSGDTEDLVRHLDIHSHKSYKDGDLSYVGYGYSIALKHIRPDWFGGISMFKGLFCRRVRTETRITDSNPSPSFKVLSEAAARPIQLIYSDSDIESRISGYFEEAFGLELIVMKAGGNEIPLLVGKREPLREGEDRTTRSYLDRLMENCVPLHEQGDGMRSFASVILEMLANQAPSVLLLDEPEAFLHPPQARLLGEFLARERPESTQLFIATHSPDVLLGLLDVHPEQLRIVRIQRLGSINVINELEKEKAIHIANDPLMRYSSVLSGIFYERAIICESDADCQFYQAILAQPSVHQGVRPDVLFLHASGKHRMAAMASALKALGVPVDIVADIDLLRERDSCRQVVEVMGGDWSSIETTWDRLRSSIESRKPWLSTEAIEREIQEVFYDLDGKSEFPDASAGRIKKILTKSSPWASVKEAGYAAIPSGDPTRFMKHIKEFLEKIGVWIVPVGELEGFCRSIGGHGPRWVQKVVEERDLSEDPEISDAREFIKTIWAKSRT